MSLNYDWTRTEGHETLSPDMKYLACMSTMLVGVGDLSTDKSYAEYVLRLKVFEALHGGLLYGEDGMPRLLSDALASGEVVIRGLRTNVSLEPRARWLKAKTDQALKDLLRFTTTD